MSQWIYIGLFVVVGLIIPVGAITVAWILGPKKSSPMKMTTYECGIETVGESWVQFKAQYYIFALVFLVFDVETVFLFPWAVRLGQLGLFAVLEGNHRTNKVVFGRVLHNVVPEVLDVLLRPGVRPLKPGDAVVR